ncbi:hypothetical protein K4F52_000456 [Lecanicillium sp. MT-2017a]|nr:hypothetical protein K4F52_000456 [Lecanicillium sp. MT-2017a]
MTYPPDSGDPTGTVIVEVPSGTFTGPWTTITQTGSTITAPTTVTRPPGSGDPTGTVIVEVPSGTFTGPWTTITQTGSTITAPTTVTRPPGSGDPTGTVIVEVPPAPSTSPLTNTPTGTSPTDSPPPGSASSNPSGSQAPSTTFTGPWTTITNTVTSITATMTQTQPPGSGVSTGTVIVEVPPASSAPPQAEPYEPCPDSGIQGSPTCCELNLAGVIAGECIAPDKTPSSGKDFEAICAENGRTPFCCVLSDVVCILMDAILR